VNKGSLMMMMMMMMMMMLLLLLLLLACFIIIIIILFFLFFIYFFFKFLLLLLSVSDQLVKLNGCKNLRSSGQKTDPKCHETQECPFVGRASHDPRLLIGFLGMNKARYTLVTKLNSTRSSRQSRPCRFRPVHTGD